MPADRRTEETDHERRALGRLVVYLRTRSGATQKALAQAMRTSSSRLSMWERGLVKLQVRSRDKLAHAFGLDRLALEELAQRIDRSVTRHLAGRESHVKEPGPEAEALEKADAATLQRLMEEVRLRRRDLDAERSEIENAKLALEGEERYLDFLIRKLRGS